MWPFKKKEEKPKTYWQIEAIKKIQAFRSIGETFKFLDTEFVVASHYSFNGNIYGYMHTPELKANYKDNNGIIRTSVFSYKEVLALIAADL